MRRVIIGAMLLLTLTGCGGRAPQATEPAAPPPVVDGGSINKIVDKEEGVICYIYGSNGIFCLRIEDEE